MTAENTSHGTTTVDTQVYTKIAAQAASKIPGVGAGSGGLLHLGKPRVIAGKPDATVEVLGNTVAVDLKVGIRYPLNLRQTCDAIRQQVIDELMKYLGSHQFKLISTLLGFTQVQPVPKRGFYDEQVLACPQCPDCNVADRFSRAAWYLGDFSGDMYNPIDQWRVA